MAKVVKSNREVLDVDQELEKLNSKTKKKDSKVTEKETSKKEKESKKKEKDNKKAKDTKKKSKEKKVKKPRRGIFKYFHEVKVEVSKVKWPSKKDMIKYSTATLVFILFFSAFFYVIDLVFALIKAGV